MRKLLALVLGTLLGLPSIVLAHRLDEYLEATILSIEANRVDGALRLVPGVAVASAVIALIDTNGDGILSPGEQQAYSQHVLSELSLSMDGRPLELHLASARFPSVDEMKQGIGEIQLGFTSDFPKTGSSRRLVFENHHQSGLAVFLVNSLMPLDKEIRITAQSRNNDQSFYQLDFQEGAGNAAARSWPTFSGFAGAFHLGARHIAEGTDHLLFLLALLLPAPLLAANGRWRQCAPVRRSLLHIFRIVTAFTLGHSLTLALAAIGVMRLPSRPVEILIAVSISVSAIHALRPIFPGREAVVAAFFGLIHGLAFATALTELGFGQWYRLVSILGFNLGIEAMQLAVVAAILPSLLLMSRTSAYSALRIGGALFAGLASAGWMVERLFNVPNAIEPLVEGAAREGPWIAVGLFLLSSLCGLRRQWRRTVLSWPRSMTRHSST